MIGLTKKEKYTNLDFLNLVSDAVNKFKFLNKNSFIKIIAHIDCDGLSSTSIIVKALEREDFKFSVRNVKQIDNNVLDELEKEEFDILFFLDLGGEYIKEIENRFKKPTFILDHHKFEHSETNITIINPIMLNLDYREISSSGVCYLFAKCLNEKNKDLAYIALMGAVGDMQEKNGFIGLNSLILEDAKEKLDVSIGPRFFGIQTRPINKVLEYSTDPFIPNVSGSEEGAIKFLDELNIDVRDNYGNFKKLIDLSQDDVKKLTSGIILNRLNQENPEDIFGNLYTLKEEALGTPMKDLKEFSTLLNAVGRFGKGSLGVSICLRNEDAKKEALGVLSSYKIELIDILKWFNENKDQFFSEGIAIINAKDSIKDSMIGTLASIVTKSNVYDPGTIVVALAHTEEDEIKISCRVAGNVDIDVRGMLKESIAGIGDYPCGGHKTACGALIPKSKEEEFIKAISNISYEKWQ